MSLLADSIKVVDVCANGTEHTHPDFVSLLRANDSAGAKFVRYAPDGVFLCKTGELVHFDAKAAKSIEKDAYETYMGMNGLGCRVMLFVLHDNKIWFQNIEQVRLIDGEETVSKFATHRRWPVEDGWICPRKKNGFTANGRMSGTPYREIDFTSMRVWNHETSKVQSEMAVY